MRIVTKYTSNNNGTGQIIAKANGKQKTVQYDDAHSADWNHGTAAGALIVHLSKNDSWVLPDAMESIDEGNAVHTLNDNGSHVFSI